MRASLEQERECGVIRTPLPDHDSSCLDCTTLNFHFNESSLTSLFLQEAVCSRLLAALLIAKMNGKFHVMFSLLVTKLVKDSLVWYWKARS